MAYALQPVLPDIQKVPIQPVDCVKRSWAAIKDQYWLFLGVTLVGVLVGGAVPVVLMGPMMCGIYLCYLQKLGGVEVEFATLFQGFDHFKDSLLATLIMVGSSLVFILPVVGVYVAGLFVAIPMMAEENPGGGLLFVLVIVAFYLVLIAVGLLLGLFFLFTFPLIVDRRLSAWDAVKTSARAAWSNLGGLVALMLLTALMSFAGLLACYVGVFLVMPISFGAFAVAYRKLFPAEVPAT